MSNETSVDKCLCAAPYCNMIGTMSRQIGSEDWYCFIHSAARLDDWNAISAELNRLGWLVEAVKAIRAGAPEKKMVEVRRNIGLAQRGDLMRKESESSRDWFIRLEQVLADSCAAVRQQEVSHEHEQGSV